jgi:cell pole-organizing protein PopZ
MTTTAPAAPPSTDGNMEDILTTIRNVIAGDGSDQPSPDEDVLELTEIVKEGKPIPSAAPTAAPSVESAAAAFDMPAQHAAPALEIPTAEAPIIAPVQEILPADLPPVAPPAAPIEPQAAPQQVPLPSFMAPLPSIMSDGTAKTSSDTIKAFADLVTTQHGGLKFRSGMTLEDIVIEALKPQLSEWLDKHLPGLVGRIVEREIQKLIPNED